jgi:hypothetical protein
MSIDRALFHRAFHEEFRASCRRPGRRRNAKNEACIIWLRGIFMCARDEANRADGFGTCTLGRQ